MAPDEPPMALEKPPVFTVGARVLVKYRSVHDTREDNEEVIGFVIQDQDDVLVVEEYSNFTRKNPHRHVIVDTETMDVYSQTENQTRHVGQVAALELSAPPWESSYDTLAGGLGYISRMTPGMRMIEEGVYKYPDPDRLGKPDDWTPESEPDHPIPEEIRQKASDVLSPPVTELP